MLSRTIKLTHASCTQRFASDERGAIAIVFALTFSVLASIIYSTDR